MKRGFTLIELLIAVLIIGVLTAMALPMYQKSVDKSRYSTLMPLAKNIKDAQEAFYLGGGKYSQDLGSLDVRVPGNPSGASATLSDGTTVEISTDDGFGYVKMGKENLNNHYIVYQDRSENFPGEIHCEALSSSDRAQELCQNLGGQKISGSLTSGYTTYILSGSGAGSLKGIPTEGPCTVNTSYEDCVRYTYADGSAYETYSNGSGTQARRDYDENGTLTHIWNKTASYEQDVFYKDGLTDYAIRKMNNGETLEWFYDENGKVNKQTHAYADGSHWAYTLNNGKKESFTKWNGNNEIIQTAAFDADGNQTNAIHYVNGVVSTYYDTDTSGNITTGIGYFYESSDPTKVRFYDDYTSDTPAQTKYYEDGSVRGYYTLVPNQSIEKGDGVVAVEYNQDGSLRQSRDYGSVGKASVIYEYRADGTYVAMPTTADSTGEGVAVSDTSQYTYGTYTVGANGDVTRSDGVVVPGSSHYPTLCEAHPDFAQCAG